MASTISTFGALLKTRYTAQKVANLTQADRPFLAMLKKDETFSGDAMVVPLIYGAPQGIAGSTLAVAQTNATNLKSKKFTLTTGDYMGTVSIGDKVVKQSKSNLGAFLQNRTAEIDSLYDQMADNLCTYLTGNGGGAIGQVISTYASGAAFGLADPSDIFAFEVDMVLVASTGDGSDTGHALEAGTMTVTAVDVENGIVTVGAAVGTLAANMYLFRQGDFRGNTTTSIIHGVQSYIYSTSTAVPNLYGMVRTDHPTRLAGFRIPAADVAGRSIEDRLQMLGARMTGRGKGPGPDAGFLNPEDWQELAIALQSRGVRPLEDKSTSFGFQALEVVMGGKLVKLYADRYFPKGTFFALRMENWTLHSTMAFIHAVEEDGNVILRAATTNDYEYRLVSYPVLGNNAPGWSGRVPLTG